MNYIDLFAGASGMSEGFKKAGFNPVCHIEMDKDACNTIKTRTAYHYLQDNNKSDTYFKYLKGEISQSELYKNIPSDLLDSVFNIEISDSSIDSIFSKIKSRLDNKQIDVIIGGPPCQAYSLIGRHQIEIENDPRNKLYIQYGRFLKEFKPRAFVFENVPGLLSANKGKYFEDLKKYFENIGYIVYPEILDASDYGVLQTRKRVIIVGWLKGYDKGFPAIELKPHSYNVNDVFSDLQALNAGESFKVSNYSNNNNEYLQEFGIRNGVDFVTQHISRPHNERDLEIYEFAISKWKKERVRIKYTDIPEKLRTHNNLTSFLDRFKVVDGNGLSHTVVAHIAKDGHYYIHPDINQCRSISVREAARLQSFPDDFYFEGSRTSAFKQIGNAVPPLLSYVIAKQMGEML